MLDHFAESAKTMALIAIIIQAIFAGLFAVYFAIIFGFLALIPATPGVVGNPGFLIFVVFGIIFGAVGSVWVLLDYFLVYKRISEGNIIGAKDTALILGIVQLIFGGVIPGVLLIVAYTQLGDSVYFAGHQQQN